MQINCKKMDVIVAGRGAFLPFGVTITTTMAGSFFTILKMGCIYRHKPASFEEAKDMIARFIYFNNHERVQLITGEAPLSRRLSINPGVFLQWAFL